MYLVRKDGVWQEVCKGGALSGLVRLGKAVWDRRGWD